jgi:hypothetical protein
VFIPDSYTDKRDSENACKILREKSDLAGTGMLFIVKPWREHPEKLTKFLGQN